MKIYLAFSHSHSSGFVDAFIRGAAFSTARRFINRLPFSVILVISAIALFLFVGRFFSRRKTRV